MNFFKYLAVFGFVLTVEGSLAQAAKPLDWMFPPAVPNFTMPYHEGGRLPQNSQYKERHQHEARHWAVSRGGHQRLLNQFYQAQIITDQYVSDDVPVVEVGNAFMQLSGHDQRRVMDFIDDMYGATRYNNHNGVIRITYWRTGEPIGLYTKYGLQLQ